MASRKLVRDFLLSSRPLFRQLSTQQGPSTRLRLQYSNGYMGYRQFGVFNEFSQKVKGEADRNKEFQNSVKELKEKAEELKGKKDELKERTKKTTEQLYRHVDGVWTEAEATAKKVSSNVKEKISSATEEVIETFGIGKQESSDSKGTSAKDGADVKQESSGSDGTSDKHGTDANDSQKASSNGEAHEQTGTTGAEETFFGKFRSKIPSSKVSSAFQKLKETKVTDFVKQGYEVVKDELTGKPSRRKHLEYTPPSFSGEISTKTDVVVMQSKQSRWNKEWEAFKGKVRGHRLFKRFSGISEPVVTKSQEIAEDMRERWETSDNPVVHKIQDFGDTILQETDAASSIKEIRRRDPSFSLPDFVAEVQDAIRPVLNAYMKGDLETLKKFCSPEVISRCEAEHKAFKSHGIFFDNKILHISEVEVRETKMMGTSPIIIVVFQTQQVHCVRDQNGQITEGGKDTIHTVYYAWAMQQVDPEDLGSGAIYPIWRLREMQQLGIQALI